MSNSQNVWFLNDCDPDYQNIPFNDSLKLFQSDGSEIMSKSGFNICQQLSGTRLLAVTSNGDYCWLSENVGNKLSKIDKNGNLIKQIDKSIGAIDICSNGNIFALGTNGTIMGDSIYIFDSIGNVLKSAPYGGIDLVVDEAHNAVWIVGSDIKKLDLSLSLDFVIDPIAWTAMSVDFSTDGSVWVGEGEYVPGNGQDRILHISQTGIIIDSISLVSRPNCIRVNRKDGNIWIASISLYSLDHTNLTLNQIANGGFTLSIDNNENIWIAGYFNLRKYSKSGSLLIAITNFGDYNQAYIATEKDYSLSIDENSKPTSNLIEMFPNPANNKLTIEASQKTDIVILNLKGQIIKRINAAEKQTTIDISDLARGMYFIKVRTKKDFAVKKFIKE